MENDRITNAKVDIGQGMVLKALRTKFGSVAQELESTVRYIKDTPTLEALIEDAIASASLDEFFGKLTERTT